VCHTSFHDSCACNYVKSERHSLCSDCKKTH
jgi:hypothetical protein